VRRSETSPSTAFDSSADARAHEQKGRTEGEDRAEDAGTLEGLRLENGRWTFRGTHDGREVVRAEPFAEMEIDLASLRAD
jgi:hypothetical protein